MLRALFLVGTASAAIWAAKKFYGTEFDRAVGTLKSTAKDIGGDLRRKDKAVTSSVEDISRKAI